MCPGYDHLPAIFAVGQCCVPIKKVSVISLTNLHFSHRRNASFFPSPRPRYRRSLSPSRIGRCRRTLIFCLQVPSHLAGQVEYRQVLIIRSTPIHHLQGITKDGAVELSSTSPGMMGRSIRWSCGYRPRLHGRSRDRFQVQDFLLD